MPTFRPLQQLFPWPRSCHSLVALLCSPGARGPFRGNGWGFSKACHLRDVNTKAPRSGALAECILLIQKFSEVLKETEKTDAPSLHFAPTTPLLSCPGGSGRARSTGPRRSRTCEAEEPRSRWAETPQPLLEGTQGARSHRPRRRWAHKSGPNLNQKRGGGRSSI